MILENVIPALEASVGPGHLLTSPEKGWTYADDATDRAHMPDGVVFPGFAPDQELTRALVKASRALNLTVHDHLIIGRHGYFSLAEKDML